MVYSPKRFALSTILVLGTVTWFAWGDALLLAMLVLFVAPIAFFTLIHLLGNQVMGVVVRPADASTPAWIGHRQLLKSRKVVAVDDVAALAVRTVTITTGKGSSTFYHVLARSHAEHLLFAAGTPEEAKRLSEWLASRIKKDIHDFTHGGMDVRNHLELDVTWRDKLAARTDVPAPGAHGRLKVLRDQPDLVIELPKDTTNAWGVVFLTVMVGGIAFMIASPWVGLVAFSMLAFLPAALRTTTLEANSRDLTFKHRFAFLHWQKSLDLSTLEEAHYHTSGPRRGIVLGADHWSYRCSADLTAEEWEWLQSRLGQTFRSA